MLFNLYHSMALSHKFISVSMLQLICKEQDPDTGKSRGSVQHVNSKNGYSSLTRILRNKCFQEIFTALPFVGNKGFYKQEWVPNSQIHVCIDHIACHAVTEGSVSPYHRFVFKLLKQLHVLEDQMLQGKYVVPAAQRGTW